MNMIEAMAARVSTRSFGGGSFTRGEADTLSAMLDSVQKEKTPFGNKVRLALYENADDGKPAKLGTYGLISGASAFIVPAVSKGRGAMEDTGFILEKAVLEATALGFGSCWIGGVFSRGKAAEAVGASEGELVPAVIALGKPAIRRSLADRIVTGAAKSRSRKSLELIVFTLDGASLKEPWLGVAAATQGAPSASNKQPWRLLRVTDTEWVLFLAEDKIYNNSLGEAHIQNLDMGIAMRHFFEAAKAADLPGGWAPVTENRDSLKTALRFGEERKWTPIALWK
jgi:nitroreductase